MYQITKSKRGWSAAQANAEGWAIRTDVEWAGNRIVKKTTTIIPQNAGGWSEEEALDWVAHMAQTGSEYHRVSLGMVGVERMTWDGDVRTARTFTDINGDTSDLPL